jgi:hypothetical protein
MVGRNSDVTDPLVIRNARGGGIRATAGVVDRGNAFMAPYLNPEGPDSPAVR